MNQQVKRNRYHIAILTLLTALLLCVPLSPSNLKAQPESDNRVISPRAENNSKTELSSLTNSEKNWLSAHKTISVAFDGHFPPYSFLNENGQLEGFSVEVMQLLADKLGITFKISSQTTWKDLYQAAQKHQVDIVATMGDRPERREWFVFTRPYIHKSLAIMAMKNQHAITSPQDLSGKRVALVKSYQYVTPLLDKYPTIKPYFVDTMLDGMNAVATGQADAVITFVGAGHYLQSKYQLNNLHFVAVLEKDKFTESIGVRKDWPELATLLDKTLSSIPEEERLSLREHWVGPEVTVGISPQKVFTYVSAVGVIALIFFTGFGAWNSALKKQVIHKTAELRRELAERQHVEKTLRQSEERFRAIFNASNDAFFIHDIDTGQILDVNQKMLDMFKITREEALNTNIGALSSGVPPYTQEDAVYWVKKAAAGEPQLFTWHAKDIEGNLFWTEVNMTRAAIGPHQRIIVTARDVTERKKLELELLESRNQLKSILRSAPVGIGQVTDREINFVNEQFAQMLGYSVSELMGKNSRFVYPSDEEFERVGQYKYEEIKKKGTGSIETILQKKNGTLIDVFLSSTPVDLDDWSQGVTFTALDITERKKNEQELREHRDHLGKLVEERTKELQNANDNYVVINEELKEFAYIVSHDLKAPLRAISQLTHWIAEDYAPAFDDEGKKQMDLILQRVKRMDNLIDAILRYSRISKGRMKEDAIDLNPLVNEVIAVLSTDTQVKITVDNKLPTISGDSVRLEQVFQNLIGNAIKFMDKNDGVVNVGCSDEPSLWKFYVSDNGPGIEEKYHQTVFQIFQTLTPRDERESTGIGLSLVKKIINLYGGTIWIESIVGEETTFFFTLPKKGGEQ